MAIICVRMVFITFLCPMSASSDHRSTTNWPLIYSEYEASFSMYLIQLSNLFSTWNSMLGFGEKKQEWRRKGIAKRCFFCSVHWDVSDVKWWNLFVLGIMQKKKISHTMKFSQCNVRWSFTNLWTDEIVGMNVFSLHPRKRKKDQLNCAWSKKVPKKIISLSFYKIKLLWHKPKQKRESNEIWSRAAHTSFE